MKRKLILELWNVEYRYQELMNIEDCLNICPAIFEHGEYSSVLVTVCKHGEKG